MIQYINYFQYILLYQHLGKCAKPIVTNNKNIVQSTVQLALANFILEICLQKNLEICAKTIQKSQH